MFALRPSCGDAEPIKVGSVVSLSYPCPGEGGEFRRLRVRVQRIRDLMRNPLTPMALARRPFARWSRWAIYGETHDRPGIVRRFDLGSSVEYRASGLLKVALYEPGANRPTWPFPRAFGATRAERALLVHCLREWLSRDLADLQLMIYCDDLSVCS